MSNEEFNSPAGGGARVSRRQFFKAGGLFAGTALFAGAGLTACAPQGELPATGEDAAPAAAVAGADGTMLTYSVYDTDVLVIGTGFGGMAAAMQAMAKGQRVLMIDKASFGFSGAQGMNWDQEVTWPDEAPESFEFSNFNDTLANQKLVKNVWEMVGNEAEAWNAMLWWVRMGGTTWNRLPDGSIENLISAGQGVNLVQRGFSRHHTDLMKTLPITVMDNTMITDLFVNDGQCVGAIGYHSLTGEYRVFRAKATVSSVGACCQMYGWLDVHPVSMNVPDNTGDVDAAAYRHGCSLIGNEFFGVDLISVEPSSLGASFNAGIGADGNHMKYVCDKDGNFFMRETDQYDVSRAIRDTVLAGKGGEHGGVFIDLTDPDALDRENTRPCYARNVELWKSEFGIDVTEPGYKIPVKLEAFEHGGTFLIDENAQSQLPGLFGTRGYGEVKGHITQQTFVGSYAGRRAAEYAASAAAPAIDWSVAEAEISRIDEIRTRSAENGIRPHVIRHNLQTTFYDAYEPATDADKLQACLDEIERIKSEDLPKMTVMDKSVVWNREWRDAIENYNLIDMTEAVIRAAMLREESRDTFYRTDFPEPDEENWHASITCTLKDGVMQAEKFEQVMA
ncbi:FAD-dependent oxidoreductase [Adlercreutzia caecimuris]|jgi:succinate dehydrogenase / fumarate reductase flavoprotein subunit|uniref:FAD-dependent oxidoreductase n=1 Tax=Adlercreutzia caecimuris TaxID=671266 RepID=UPI0013728517|nr:FAD-binding protein [Adlercreutzia caecimuris]MCR2037289.1 FAD-binding protein [Adlercreutzia caecimuris]